MRRICLTQKDIGKGNLILVNEDHPLKSGLPGLQLTRTSAREPKVLLGWQAAKMLEKVNMILGCEEEILAISGYRTREEQEEIYEESLQENGLAFTQKYVALPGCSEHQTGLAIDLGRNQEEIDFIRPDFPYDGICGKFRQLSVQYGFIERYPAGGESVTKIAHEPWHFRYVGYPHSALLSETKMTLEEYTAEIQHYVYGKNHLHWGHSRQAVEIFYVPLCHRQEAVVEIPSDLPCQVSGNNEQGVVVTLWRNKQ